MAPAIAPKNWAGIYTPNRLQSPLDMATPTVTAGFKWPSLPIASAVNTPAMTAKHQPVVITIQPLFSPFVCRSTTFATTPLPSKIMIIVPKNSPKNAECILSPCRRRLLLFDPVQRPAYGFLPRAEQRAAAAFCHLRFPALIDSPIAHEIFPVAPIPDGQTRGISRAQRGRLGDFRPDHRHIENVGLKLHEQFIDHHAAVDAQFGDTDCRVLGHGP